MGHWIELFTYLLFFMFFPIGLGLYALYSVRPPKEAVYIPEFKKNFYIKDENGNYKSLPIEDVRKILNQESLNKKEESNFNFSNIDSNILMR